MKELNFNFKIGNLEARSCGEHLFVEGVVHNNIEIVQWLPKDDDDIVDIKQDKYCWVIAYFLKGKEGYYIKFVGDRPFDDRVNGSDFMYLAFVSQRVLDRFFEEIE